jgi:hypothetical protein
MCVSSVGFFEYREVISLSSIYQLAFVRGRGYVFCEIEALFFGIIFIVVPTNFTINNINIL